MCEIFAISSKHPVGANARLQEFFSHGLHHPHGWGLAWRDQYGWQVYKESLASVDSNYLRYVLEEPLRTNQLVGHIRYATRGVVSIDNCHPFVGFDETGTQWVIAHNGTIFNTALIQGYEAIEAGETDSEQVVLFLLDLLNAAAMRNGGSLDFAERFVILSQAVASLSVSNKLNLVLNDGVHTYVHTNTVRDTLFVEQRLATTFFCTVPLDDGGEWKPVPHCRLIAYKDGHMERIAAAHCNSFDDEAYLQHMELLSFVQ
ncbi:MAG: class II glutamine amidotransferase [Atopobiaceae bacterium]|nr:class II glutamine amidotransferase [Atopobiaceae bacterium]